MGERGESESDSESAEYEDDDPVEEPTRVRRGTDWVSESRCRHHFPLFDPRCNEI